MVTLYNSRLNYDAAKGILLILDTMTFVSGSAILALGKAPATEPLPGGRGGGVCARVAHLYAHKRVRVDAYLRGRSDAQKRKTQQETGYGHGVAMMPCHTSPSTE